MTVHVLKGAREAPRNQRSKMETMLLTPALMKEWLAPPFQRPLKVNDKIRTIASDLREATRGCIEGVITLGQVDGDKQIFLVDGQHRREAALLSELPELLADVRLMRFETMAEMAEEFVRLNMPLVRMNPDDVLRGMEGSLRPLQIIRKACPFVGYGYIRRGTDSPTLSMSVALRCWKGSYGETPQPGHGSSMHMAQTMTEAEADELTQFLNIARAAWGNDMEYARLWGILNLTMTMWLWHNLVTDRDRSPMRRYVKLNAEQFRKCLMTVSTSGDYLDWLQGRRMCERDRAPSYARLKALFGARLREEKFANQKMPQPPWVTK